MIKTNSYNFNFFKFSLLFFALSFNLGLAINSIAFVLAVVTLSFYFLRDKGYKNFKISLYTKLLLLFALFVLIIEAINNNNSLRDFLFHKSIAFLTLPILINLNKIRVKKIINSILFYFVIGCVLNALINWAFAVYRGWWLAPEGINHWYFSYNFFAEPFGIQPIYLGLYYVSALVFIHFIKINKYLYIFIAIFLFLSTLMLAARNAIFSMILFIPALVVIKQKLKFKQVLLILIFGITSTSFVLQNPIVKNRLFKVAEKGNFYSGHSLRLDIWSSAFEVGRNNVFGLGEAKSEKQLIEKFKEKQLTVPVIKKYNAHSQYLQSFVQHGILGAVFLITIFLYLLINFKSNKNHLGIIWLVIIILSAITESIFVRQWGSFFFVFFSVLMSLKYKEINKNRLTHHKSI